VVGSPRRHQEVGVVEDTKTASFTRRAILRSAAAAGAGFASGVLVSPTAASDSGDDVAIVEQFTGETPVESDRVHLVMPRTFPNGYTVPLSLQIDTPMTEADHVRHVRVFAPRNPLIEVVRFHFVPLRSEPRVSTRVRLAEPQYVLAVAEMNDGALLMTKTWVEVATNGCA
jgi:sulfur-oxidizing protein SoxY